MTTKDPAAEAADRASELHKRRRQLADWTVASAPASMPNLWEPLATARHRARSARMRSTAAQQRAASARQHAAQGLDRVLAAQAALIRDRMADGIEGATATRD